MMQRVTHFDVAVTERVQAIRLSGFRKLMWTATFAGNGLLLVIIALVATIRASNHHQWDIAQAFVLAMVLMGLYNASKWLFRRPRPDTVYGARHRSSSFPSGHAADSVAVYGLIGYLVFVGVDTPWRYLGIILGLGLPLLIGTSRVYLGAHHPSDVIAGWSVAIVGLTATILFFNL